VRVNVLDCDWNLHFTCMSSLRIRLPPPDYDNRIGKPKAKNSLVMSFGGSMTGVRNKADMCPQTSVDLMSGSGTFHIRYFRIK
jgi:hypothetical protein